MTPVYDIKYVWCIMHGNPLLSFSNPQGQWTLISVLLLTNCPLLRLQNGLESIPASWRAKTLGYAEAEAAVDVLLAANAKLSA